MTFPRNPDNSLDYDTFSKLPLKDQREAKRDLKENGAPEEIIAFGEWHAVYSKAKIEHLYEGLGGAAVLPAFENGRKKALREKLLPKAGENEEDDGLNKRPKIGFKCRAFSSLAE